MVDVNIHDEEQCIAQEEPSPLNLDERDFDPSGDFLTEVMMVVYKVLDAGVNYMDKLLAVSF